MAAAASSPTVGMPTILDHMLPDADREIEWWYLHGLLDDRYLLMVCFWRYGGLLPSLPVGATAAYSLTTVDGTSRRQGNLIDRAFLRQLRALTERYLRTTTDPFFEAFQEATRKETVFAPHRLVDGSRIAADSEGLRLAVGPCTLRCDPDSTLRVAIDDDSLQVDLALDGGRPGFASGRDGSFRVAGKRMSGHTFPRLPARGTLAVAGERNQVEGSFWLDHQWGDWTFTRPRRHFYHPEWLYYAAVLEDGRSLVVFEARSPEGEHRSREVAYIALQEADGRCRYLDQARISPHRRIESLRTHNTYEYGWTLELPEVDGSLEFQPFHEDQELLVLTRQRGILEAGCHVSGRLGGAECGGWGFVEAFGDTLDINEFFWGRQKATLTTQLERFVPRSSDPAWLARVLESPDPLAVDHEALDHGLFGPLWSMMDRGGKGWRSSWLTTCYYAYGRDDLEDQVRTLLPVSELLHTGSLIIDDIQDRATVRRRLPALHLEVGTDIAINVGCFCYFLPFRILEELSCLDDRQRSSMYAVIINALRQGHVGQAMDLMWSGDRYDILAKVADFETTRAQLLEQYRLKSGCQLEAVARIAGILAGAPEAMVGAAAEYSRTFGIVFQVLDDVIGIQDGYRQLGKQEGEDVTNRKLNMVLLYALAAIDPDERPGMVERLSGGGADAVDTARRLIDRTDSATRCLDDAEALLEGCWEPMGALPNTDAKLVMRSVPRWLLAQRRAQIQRRREP